MGIAVALDDELTRATTRIGVILTADNAIDAELWRWCPPEVSLHVTRMRHPGPHAIGDMALSEHAADPGAVDEATRTLVDIHPAVVAFACTSGSFIHGLAGERAIRATMRRAGAERAITTSGAAVAAFRALGLRRIAVVTPYDEPCSRRLAALIEDVGIEVTGLAYAPPSPGTLADYPRELITRSAERALSPAADGLFISCTALETADMIGPLMQRYGIPVLSSVQVTMWAALAAAGARSPALT